MKGHADCLILPMQVKMKGHADCLINMEESISIIQKHTHSIFFLHKIIIFHFFFIKQIKSDLMCWIC